MAGRGGTTHVLKYPRPFLERLAQILLLRLTGTDLVRQTVRWTRSHTIGDTCHRVTVNIVW